MGPDRLLDSAARPLQTDANRCQLQGVIGANSPNSGLKKRHNHRFVNISRHFMKTVTTLSSNSLTSVTAFQKRELSQILDVYGRLVLAGQARDYGIGMYRNEAVFAIYRRHAEQPTWRIMKTPALARAQGAYSVIGGEGQMLKRGRELSQVLSVFDKRRFQIVS